MKIEDIGYDSCREAFYKKYGKEDRFNARFYPYFMLMLIVWEEAWHAAMNYKKIE